MAFGAVGGIESGITMGERFDATSLMRPRDPNDKPFSPAPRVYLHEINSMVSRQTARMLFENRPMIAALGCRDRNCCSRGAQDMIKDPRRHFVIRRTAEVDRIGAAPPDLRAHVYVQDILRPAALLSVRAARVAPDLEKSQHRLESWNLTLTAMSGEGSVAIPVPALGQRISVARKVPRVVK